MIVPYVKEEAGQTLPCNNMDHELFALYIEVLNLFQGHAKAFYSLADPEFGQPETAVSGAEAFER
ncbi:MAG: hypothetical protein P8M73_04760 [Luminiphilus sp.]|nr:hypothetical protein [Luminiphilus sp.]